MALKINWHTVAHLGAAIVNKVLPGVADIERLATSLPGARGREKQDKVVELVKAALLAEQGLTGKQLAQDADVEAATRGVIDAVVALHNIVAHKTVAPTA